MSTQRTFFQDFRLFFFRGLGILLPSVITLGILIWAVGFLNSKVAGPINSVARQGVIWTMPRLMEEHRLPEWMRVTETEIAEFQAERRRTGLKALPEATVLSQVRSVQVREHWDSHWYLKGIGFLLAILLVYLAGVFVGNLIGRRVYHLLEKLITRVPIIKQVYPSVKQVTDFLLGGGDAKRLPGSGKVVLVEYPRKGIWTVGLLTGSTMRSIQETAGSPCVTVFIPSSPTPFTGYTITVPADEVRELSISLDEALRFIVSGGVLVPESQTIEDGEQGKLFDVGEEDASGEGEGAAGTA